MVAGASADGFGTTNFGAGGGGRGGVDEWDACAISVMWRCALELWAARTSPELTGTACVVLVENALNVTRRLERESSVIESSRELAVRSVSAGGGTINVLHAPHSVCRRR